jgi:hypothetical protein
MNRGRPGSRGPPDRMDRGRFGHQDSQRNRSHRLPSRHNQYGNSGHQNNPQFHSHRNQGNQNNMLVEPVRPNSHNNPPIQQNNQRYPIVQQSCPPIKVEQELARPRNYSTQINTQQPYQPIKVEQDLGIPDSRTIQNPTIHGSNQPNFSARNGTFRDPPQQVMSMGNRHQSGNFQQTSNRFQRPVNDFNPNFPNNGPQNSYQSNPPPLQRPPQNNLDLNRRPPHRDMQTNQPSYQGPRGDFNSNLDRSHPQHNYHHNAVPSQHPSNGDFYSNGNRNRRNDFQQNPGRFQQTSTNDFDTHRRRQQNFQQNRPFPQNKDYGNRKPYQGPVSNEFGDGARWSNSQQNQPKFQNNGSDHQVNQHNLQPSVPNPAMSNIGRQPHGDGNSANQRPHKKRKRVPAALAMF